MAKVPYVVRGARFASIAATTIAASSSFAACVTNRFESIATQAAAQQTTTKCDSSTAVTTYPLEEDYAFRIDTCEGPTYWRCWYKRRTVGHVQCCARVADQDAATATFSPSLDGDPTAFCGESP
jgi:hypothetical protein